MAHRLEPDRPRIVAFIENGANSVRLLIALIELNHAYRILSDQEETVRLGEDEFIEQASSPKPCSARVGL